MLSTQPDTYSDYVKSLKPNGSHHFVALNETSDQTAGGIYLPENSFLRRNYQHATVLRTGPGWAVPESDRRALVWVRSEDEVVFQQHHFQPLYDNSRYGFVHDEDLLGSLHGESFHPLGEWVRISLETWVVQAGQIAIPDEWQRRPTQGTLLDWGPGRLIHKGPLIGSRMPCWHCGGLQPQEWRSGATVYWTPLTEVIELGREGVEFVLIRASQIAIIAIEGKEDVKSS